MLVLVRVGKGRKDRVAILSEKSIELLRKYYLKYKPKDFLRVSMEASIQQEA